MFFKTALLLLFFVQAQCHVTCHISENDNEFSVHNERIVVGPPGKQGPRGPPGDLSQCSCSEYNELQSKIDELENYITTMKSKLYKEVIFFNTMIM